MKKIDYLCIIYCVVLLIFGFDDRTTGDRHRVGLAQNQELTELRKTKHTMPTANSATPLKVPANITTVALRQVVNRQVAGQ